MTQYRLAALTYRREIVTNPTCSECGAPRGDKAVTVERYRQGDLIEVEGAEELRLLGADALAPIDQPADPDPDGSDGTNPDGSGSNPDGSEGAADSANSGAGEGEPPADPPTPADPPNGAHNAPAVEKPRKAAPVDDWRDYAVTQGVPTDQAKDMTKAELIDKLG